MRSTMNAAADRLLAVFAPKATASACLCSPDPHYESICYNGYIWQHLCTYNCNCVDNCNPYFKTTAHC
jgi:hypothetical protein